MSLKEETLFGTKDKVQQSIDRLKAFEPKDRPYWLAFSGGKDSVCILELAKMAGVNFEAHYSVTSVDPPELVRFIKTFPEVSFDIPHDKDGKPITMWNLIAKNRMPPTQIARFCCRELKESSGIGTVTITGVRWAESVNRKLHQGVAVVQGKNKAESTIMNDDNDEARRTVENCFRTRKTLVNPIVDWTDEDVWEFIRTRNLRYCKLYNDGYERLGCIGCPMGRRQGMLRDFEIYPKYKANYLRAFGKMLQQREGKGLSNIWKTAEEVFDWWVREKSESDERETLFYDGERE